MNAECSVTFKNSHLIPIRPGYSRSRAETENLPGDLDKANRNGQKIKTAKQSKMCP